MLKASFATQCTTKTGLTGSFLYDPATGSPKEAVLLSPVFADSLDLIRFLEARGWTRDIHAGLSAYVREDANVTVRVADLYVGDQLDLEGDPIADTTPEGDPNEFEFELAAVVGFTEERSARVVETTLTTVAFAPDYGVQVAGFNDAYADEVIGVPATLMIRGVAVT